MMGRANRGICKGAISAFVLSGKLRWKLMVGGEDRENQLPELRLRGESTN